MIAFLFPIIHMTRLRQKPTLLPQLKKTPEMWRRDMTIPAQFRKPLSGTRCLCPVYPPWEPGGSPNRSSGESGPPISGDPVNCLRGCLLVMRGGSYLPIGPDLSRGRGDGMASFIRWLLDDGDGNRHLQVFLYQMLRQKSKPSGEGDRTGALTASSPPGLATDLAAAIAHQQGEAAQPQRSP